MQTLNLVEACGGAVKLRLPEVQALLATIMSEHEDMKPHWDNADYSCCPLLIGPAGIGKSAVVKQVAEAMGFRVWFYYPGSLVLEDMLGLPYREGEVVKYAAPPWYPTGPGILFIDELATADNSGQQTQIKELISEGRCGGISLPEGVHIIGASNPDTAAYTSTKTLDHAVLSRCLPIPIAFYPHDTLDYWQINDSVPDMFQSFFRKNPHLLEGGDARRVVAVGDIYNRYHKCRGSIPGRIDSGLSYFKDNDRLSIFNIIGLWLGTEISIAFEEFLTHGDDPYYYPILAKNYLCEEKNEDEHSNHIDRLINWRETGQTALIGASSHELCRAITAPNVSLSDKQSKWVAQFLDTSQAYDTCAQFMMDLKAKPHFEAIFGELLEMPIAQKIQEMFMDLQGEECGS